MKSLLKRNQNIVCLRLLDKVLMHFFYFCALFSFAILSKVYWIRFDLNVYLTMFYLFFSAKFYLRQENGWIRRTERKFYLTTTYFLVFTTNWK